jgi:hypothetical protein
MRQTYQYVSKAVNRQIGTSTRLLSTVECYGPRRHAAEGTRWESGTDAQRYGQLVEQTFWSESDYSPGGTDIRTLLSRWSGGS